MPSASSLKRRSRRHHYLLFVAPNPCCSWSRAWSSKRKLSYLSPYVGGVATLVLGVVLGLYTNMIIMNRDSVKQLEQQQQQQQLNPTQQQQQQDEDVDGMLTSSPRPAEEKKGSSCGCCFVRGNKLISSSVTRLRMLSRVALPDGEEKVRGSPAEEVDEDQSKGRGFAEAEHEEDFFWSCLGSTY